MRWKTGLTAVLFLTLSSGISQAQIKQSRPSNSGFLVETTFFKSAPPSYENIRMRDSQVPNGSWFARFGRIAGWQPAPGTLPVRAVRISPYFAGDFIEVDVSVLSGEKHLDDEKLIARYVLREEEPVSVKELRDVGVEPFVLKLMRAPFFASNLPPVEIKTQSVELVGIEPLPTAVPSYKLLLRNNTNKAINAILLQIWEGQRQASMGIPQGGEGKHLMQPGETIEWRLALHIRSEGKNGNHMPGVVMDQRIVIPAVRFADGKLEGPFPNQIDYHGERYGKKIELRRILPLFDEAMGGPDSNDAPAKLQAKIEALSFEFTPEEKEEMDAKFSDDRLRKSVDFGRHMLRNQVLQQLRTFPEDGPLFKAWLVKARASYQAFLPRLDPAVYSN